MYVSPIRNPEYKSQNPTFNAVNQKYYKLGKERIDKFGHLSYIIIDHLANDVILFKKIHPQDGADTLRALRELLKPQKSNSLEEYLGTFNILAKEDRIAKRKKLKKL